MTTHETAVTQYIVANGTKLAYRRLGASVGIPLVMMMHFRGNMDWWDPALINALAKSRPIILMDNAGIGKSEGEIPTTLHGWAEHLIALVQALKVHQIDLLGFSMGGGAAQHVALAAPKGMVRRLIIAGSRTSKTPNTVIGPRKIFHQLAHAVTEEEFKEAFTVSFFNPSEHGRAAAKTVLDRIYVRKEDRAPHLSPGLAKRQTEAFTKFSVSSPDNPYERIHELDMPVLIANGDNDLLIPTVNSFELAQLLPDAHLHIYPNSGHGFLYQYAELFAKHVDLFLDETTGEDGEKIFEALKSRLS
ncbi:alpha/beta-hydrolase [Mollisia scopiformis]|uniref:Alpha/beta-hydrolase n=1 Tax=Mollisia scopiformis TaxID=149040 RepID=A0A194XDQ2_MOLSC|nr:alpha/beta-hydrolase [Mollisia scopiformis]KUJ18303.1 alpha/beta-hydrolase [Mollisia scopiformis]